MSIITLTKQQLQDAKILTAINTYLQGVTDLVLDGQTVTVAQVKAAIQARIAATTDAESSKAQLRVKLDARKAADAIARPLVKGLRAYVELRFGKRSQAMTDFDFSIPKKPKTPVATKAAAALKVQATRKARGTTSKKQKKAIKGTVPASPTASPKPAGA
jgi:hypothetical protein